MPEKKQTAEQKLRSLGKDLRAGWQRLHPVTNKELARVRDLVSEQWKKRQEKEKAQGKKETAEKEQKLETEKLRKSPEAKQKKSTSRSRDHGHSQ